MKRTHQDEKKIKAFLSRHPIACFVRVYASKPEQVEERVKMFSELVEIINKLEEYEGIKIIKQVVAIIPTNPEYEGTLDCGKTASAIRELYPDRKKVDIIEVPYGGPFAAAFNEAIFQKTNQGYKHAFIFSSEARKCINLPTILSSIHSHIEGSLYTGLAFDDLAIRVKAGHIMNTWAFLNIYEAKRVGGFNAFAEQAVNKEMQFTMTAKDSQGNKYSYPVQGCEEGPLIHALSSIHGFCTAVIEPEGEGVWKYEPADSDEARLKHREKIITKKVRLNSLMFRCGMDPSYIWHAQLPEYRDERYNPDKNEMTA